MAARKDCLDDRLADDSATLKWNVRGVNETSENKGGFYVNAK